MEKPLKFLIVEDDPKQLEDIKSAIRQKLNLKRHIEIFDANNAEDGIEIYHSNADADILIVDLSISAFRGRTHVGNEYPAGLELMINISKQNSEIKLVAYTHTGTWRIIDKLRELNAIYIPKKLTNDDDLIINLKLLLKANGTGK